MCTLDRNLGWSPDKPVEWRFGCAHTQYSRVLRAWKPGCEYLCADHTTVAYFVDLGVCHEHHCIKFNYCSVIQDVVNLRINVKHEQFNTIAPLKYINICAQNICFIISHTTDQGQSVTYTNRSTVYQIRKSIWLAVWPNRLMTSLTSMAA
jgi:hypothetical protein